MKDKIPQKVTAGKQCCYTMSQTFVMIYFFSVSNSSGNIVITSSDQIQWRNLDLNYLPF